MELDDVIQQRRALRSLAPAAVTGAMIQSLAGCAKLAPSCYNKQPWRFVFAYHPEVLKKLFTVMSRGNEWTQQASLIIGVFSEKSLDCSVKTREYFLFDTGMAVGFMLLKAADMGLVAHPIAGFDEDKAREILDIPPSMTLITLIIVGKKMDGISPALDERKAEAEKERPPRLDFKRFAFIDNYRPPVV
jgi:nitroreductase